MQTLLQPIWRFVAVLTADPSTPTVLPALDLSKLIDLLLGPVGLTVGALFVIYQFTADKWLTAKRADAQAAKVEAVWRERYEGMKEDRDTAINIAEKAVGGYTSVADAIKERNRLVVLRLRNLKADAADLPDEPEDEEPPPRSSTAVRSEAGRTERRLRARRDGT